MLLIEVPCNYESSFEEIKQLFADHGADFSKMEEISYVDIPFRNFWELFVLGNPNHITRMNLLINQMHTLYLEALCREKPDDKELLLKLEKQKEKFYKIAKNAQYAD